MNPDLMFPIGNHEFIERITWKKKKLFLEKIIKGNVIDLKERFKGKIKNQEREVILQNHL